MSRKRKAPIRKIYPDPKYRSVIISKFINSIMYDGKRSTAEKILYDALEKIKCGATLVQLYTGFVYEGPSLIKSINKSFLDYENN